MTGYEFPNVNIRVFDTPQLRQADATGQDEQYLQKIQVKSIKFDMFLICTEMNAIRFCNDDGEETDPYFRPVVLGPCRGNVNVCQ